MLIDHAYLFTGNEFHRVVMSSTHGCTFKSRRERQEYRSEGPARERQAASKDEFGDKE
jgi:hypothetical protein